MIDCLVQDQALNCLLLDSSMPWARDYLIGQIHRKGSCTVPAEASPVSKVDASLDSFQFLNIHLPPNLRRGYSLQISAKLKIAHTHLSCRIRTSSLTINTSRE